MAKLDHIPGSNSFWELPKMLKNPIDFLHQRQALYGNIFKTRLVKPTVFLLGPEANKYILITGRDYFSWQGGFSTTAFGRLFKNSLIVSDGEQHKHDRGILQPAMGRLALEQSLHRVQNIWQQAVRKNTSVVNAYEFVQDITFEVSANVLIDLEVDSVGKYKPLFQDLVEGTMATTPFRIPFGKVDRGLRARNKLISMLIPRIDAARKRTPNGMIGLLAHHQQPDGNFLATKRIAEHLLLLFWAGYDTTASSGSWILTQLAYHPEWQEYLYEEQQTILNGQDITLRNIEGLPKCEWFLKEIERMYPSVLFFPRLTTKTINILDKEIPANTTIFYSPYLTHRLPEYFEFPNIFNPERWNPKQEKQASSKLLVGFGAGPRICLGKSFALMQLRTMLFNILQRFRIEPENKHLFRTQALPMHRPVNSFLRFIPR